MYDPKSYFYALFLQLKLLIESDKKKSNESYNLPAINIREAYASKKENKNELKLEYYSIKHLVSIFFNEYRTDEEVY